VIYQGEPVMKKVLEEMAIIYSASRTFLASSLSFFGTPSGGG
jgi:hypothetical protein